MFSPTNKIHREVGRAKDLSAPRHLHGFGLIKQQSSSRVEMLKGTTRFASSPLLMSDLWPDFTAHTILPWK